MKIGIIGGTGFYDLLENTDKIEVDTHFGSIGVLKGEYANKEVYFISRHGDKHGSLAHEVNFRGNMAAMKQLGINHVFSMVAVGSLNPEIEKGDLALLDDFIDFTTNRVKTYSSHSVDISRPYCKNMQNFFIEASKIVEIPVFEKATYITTDGPRYETDAEIKVLRKAFEGDVVGMTNGTEASLARELGICYSAISVATNSLYGNDKPDLGSHKNVVINNKEKVNRIFLKAIELFEDYGKCRCQEIYEVALKARNIEKPGFLK